MITALRQHLAIALTQYATPRTRSVRKYPTGGDLVFPVFTVVPFPGTRAPDDQVRTVLVAARAR